MPIPLVAAGLAGVLVESLPSIASWIFGNKTGKAVEVVTGAAKQVFGADDPAALEKALAADPAKALEFKRIVIEAEGRERQQAIEELTVRLHDVQSARSQTIELARANSPIAWGSPVVSVSAILVFAGFVAMLFFRVVPEGMKEALCCSAALRRLGTVWCCRTGLAVLLGQQRRTMLAADCR
ncbi:hypothetical protein [Reyranella sp.]|uniref:hypothetical protein n=1 Tax=Reyranella sp. TaxID=1929291 RepID=UPI0011FE97EA|nr:hypothetical protein [Reyranella sp.]TAJ91002.1 MAG: hypothetical protein EPO50_00280 [Reyranella sp.]